MAPKQNSGTERYEEILATTHALITEHGLEAVNLPDIAQKLGISRPAIYQYFSSRDDLLAELVINEMADLSNEIDVHVAAFEDPMERIRVWIHYSLAHLAFPEHRIISEISIARLPEESRQLIRDLHGHIMFALLSPLKSLGVSDPVATANLIFASVAASATRIYEGAEFAHEAAALEKFAIAGIEGTLG